MITKQFETGWKFYICLGIRVPLDQMRQCCGHFALHPSVVRLKTDGVTQTVCLEVPRKLGLVGGPAPLLDFVRYLHLRCSY